MYYSSKFENSPTPHSVFFRGGYAIHGTQYVKEIGAKSFPWLLRLHPRNTARLYRLVVTYGFDDTRIRIYW
jgi:hypothetical protein